MSSRLSEESLWLIRVTLERNLDQHVVFIFKHHEDRLLLQTDLLQPLVKSLPVLLADEALVEITEGLDLVQHDVDRIQLDDLLLVSNLLQQLATGPLILSPTS